MYRQVGDIKKDMIKMTGIEGGGDRMIAMRNGVVAAMMIGHLVIWIDHVTGTMTDPATETMTDPVTEMTTELVTETMTGDVIRTDL